MFYKDEYDFTFGKDVCVFLYSVLALVEASFLFRLLTPPGTPLFPSLEKESQKTLMSQLGTPKAQPTALKSRVRAITKISGHD